ncbi:MAG: site-specific DNA-methyltransferase, partial [Actinomycetota bacterium]|nr:site-specific DNA-methyltransferase [Actinomycetota bacterium]
ARKTPEAFRSWQDRLGDWPQLASSVWDIPAEAGTEGFPAAFPLELARRAIRLSTWPGELVVDPFAGSGTVLVAARSLGRHALGTEISKSTCAIAARRLREDT